MKSEHSIVNRVSLVSKIELSPDEKRDLWSKIEPNLETVSNREPNRRLKFALISAVVSVIAIPTAVYAGTHLSFLWGGALMDYSNQDMGPVSQAANPSDPYLELHSTGQTTYDLSTARLMANFQIRQPASIDGWTKMVSEGIVTPQDNYVVNGNGANQTKTLVSVTKTPLRYVDIYQNSHGQRIAVTQEYDADGTRELQQSLQGKASNGSGWILGQNADPVSGFANSQAFLITGNWVDNPVPFKGNFDNLLVLHQESNHTLTRMVIDEYGNVDPTVMESFAQTYLSAPSK